MSKIDVSKGKKLNSFDLNRLDGSKLKSILKKNDNIKMNEKDNMAKDEQIIEYVLIF